MDVGAAEALLAFAEDARPRLRGFDGNEVLAQLDERYSELASAFNWFIEHESADEAFRLANALVPFWMAKKRLAESSDWFDRALALDGGDPTRRGRALFDYGYLLFWAGEYERSSAMHHRALALGRESNDPTVTALALGGLARIALRTDLDEAKRLLREALAATEGTADSVGRSGAMHVLGVAAQMSGDLEEARRLMSERIAIAREADDAATIASEGGNLSMVERQLGNLDAAEALSREALDIVARRGDELQIPWMVNGLAAVAAARREYERAATLIGVADVTMERAGGAWPPDERRQYDETVAILTEHMDHDELDQARRTGYAMTTSDGVAFALTRGG